MKKINLIPPLVFEILKFKNLAIWLADSIFGFNLRTTFFPDMRYEQKYKGDYGSWFKPKKFTHQSIIYIYIYIYIAKSKKPYICDVFVHYLQNEVFIQKSGCINFTLKAS